jgi:carbon-monoxide dehydrogenase medium subunit
MKPAAFKYIPATSLDEVLALKAQHGDEAVLLAGGQSLLPAMNFRLTQPAIVIDINGLADLGSLQAKADGGLQLGAMVRHRMLERDSTVARCAPLLREAMRFVAHPQIRNRGTLGGNLAHADPASELPAVMLSLGARLRARSAQGERWIEAAEFFRGVLTTALRNDEVLVEVECPALAPRTGSCFMEVARRRGDFAIMGVAAVVTLDADGNCSSAQLAYCGAGDRAVSASAAAHSLVGSRIGEDDIRQAAALVQSSIDPHGSIHAGKEYQRHLAGVLTRRALPVALQRARGEVDAAERRSENGH